MGKTLIIIAALAVALMVVGIATNSPLLLVSADNGNSASSLNQEYAKLSPVEVVQKWFSSWDRQDWADMYTYMSDGFKRIEPSAGSLQGFRAFAESQQVTAVNILENSISSMEMGGAPVPHDMPGMPGMTATVDYAVEFVKADGSLQPFSESFTLKWREADVIPGWKMIHPYGQNIDTS